jgi:hypothetical protein
VSRPEATGADQGSQNLRGDIGDKGIADIDLIHPLWIDVKPGHREAGLGEHHGLWQADVAQADDPYTRTTIQDSLL